MAGTRRTRAQGASPSGFKELPPATRTRRATRAKAPASKPAANTASNAISTPSAAQNAASQPFPAMPATPATPTPLTHQSPIAKRTAALIEEETDSPSLHSPKRMRMSPSVTAGLTTPEPPQTPVAREPERPIEQNNEHANDAAVETQLELQVEPEQEPANTEFEQQITHSRPSHEQEPANIESEQQITNSQPNHEQEAQQPEQQQTDVEEPAATARVADSMLDEQGSESESDAESMTSLDKAFRDGREAFLPSKLTKEDMVQNRMTKTFIRWGDNMIANAAEKHNYSGSILRPVAPFRPQTRSFFVDDDEDEEEFEKARKNYKSDPMVRRQLRLLKTGRKSEVLAELRAMGKKEREARPANRENKDVAPNAISALLDHFASNGGPVPTADEMVHLLQAFQRAKHTEKDGDCDSCPQTPRTAPRKPSTPMPRTPVQRTLCPQPGETLNHIPEENEDSAEQNTPTYTQNGTHEQMQIEPRSTIKSSTTLPVQQVAQYDAQQNTGIEPTTHTYLPSTPVQQQSAQRSWASALSINAIGNMFRTPFQIWGRSQAPATAQITQPQEASPSGRISAAVDQPSSPGSPAVDIDTPSKPARQLLDKPSTPDQSSQEQLETHEEAHQPHQTIPPRMSNPMSPSPTPESQRVVRRRPETERRNRPKPGQLWKYKAPASSQPPRYANWPIPRNADLRASQRIANENAASLEKQIQVGDKRKRAPKAYAHPKQSSGTFGLADDFFDMSDSDEEDAQSEKTRSPSRTPPSKRARVQEPESNSDEEMMVDYPVDHFPPSKYALANPGIYRECYDQHGKQRSLFMRNGDWNMSIFREGERQMEEQREREALAKELKAAAKAKNIFKAAEQSAASTPPPPPAPSHAVLPAPNLLQAEREDAPDLLAKAREAAFKHKPANPSKLRDVTAMSPLNQPSGTSVNYTPLQQKTPVPSVPQPPQNAQSEEEGFQKENITPGQKALKSVLEVENPFQANSARAEKITGVNDPEIAKYMEENPIEGEFDHFEFPPYKRGGNTPDWLINIDQEVQDALDAIPEEDYLD